MGVTVLPLIVAKRERFSRIPVYKHAFLIEDLLR